MDGVNSYSPKEQMLIGKLCNGEQVKKLEVQRSWLLGIIISGGLVDIVMIIAMMCCRGCLPDGHLIISGLVLGIVGLGIELIDHRILVAKLLRQLSREEVTEAINELRQAGSVRRGAKGK